MAQGSIRGRSEYFQRANRRVTSRLRKRTRNGGVIYIGSRKGRSTGKKTKKSIIRVVCPPILSLHHPSTHTKTVRFIQDFDEAVRKAKSSGCTVHICFRDTKRIHASGGIYLLANTEVIVDKYPGVKFTCSSPPSLPDSATHKALPIAHSVLCQIGFYKLIGVAKPKGVQLPTVDCWHITSSDTAAGEFIGEALDKLEKIGANIQGLYKASIEAVANASEHAYSTDIKTARSFTLRKWWLFSAVMDNEVIFCICDLGHGIPVTLEHTQPPEILNRIQSIVSLILPVKSKSDWTEDAHKIKMATMVRETRTELSYRGRGGGDLRSYISKHNGAILNIYSNRGTYQLKNLKKPQKNQSIELVSLENKVLNTNNRQVELGFNNKLSINGTVVGWSMPLIKTGN